MSFPGTQAEEIVLVNTVSEVFTFSENESEEIGFMLVSIFSKD